MKISVVVTAYNHEKYITQCLESVLVQKGDFQLEIIVGDDCSIDHTREIIEEFQKSYPEIINVLPVEKNLGISKNLERCMDACSGEYIAICEGDDYWTDEAKLQKQKDFLDVHRDCSMCFSAILLHYEEKSLSMPHPAQASLQTDAITMEDLIGNNYIGNFSCCMYRTDIVKQLPQGIYDLGINTDDWMFGMACGQFGRIGFIPEIMSVYRIHAKGTWSGKDTAEQLEFVCMHMDVSNKFFGYKYDALFSQRKKTFEEQIARSRTPLVAQANDTHGSKSLISESILRIKEIFQATLRFLGRK